MKRVKRILLIDDDVDDTDLFRDVLKELDPLVEIHTLHNSVDLIEHIDRISPDFIFLDINMPFRNGFECLETIRKHPKHNRLLVAIYSTSGSDKQIKKAYDCRANMYIQKPSSLPSIKKVIEKVITLDLSQFIPPPPDFNRFVIQ